MKKIEFFDKVLKGLIILFLTLFIEMEFVYAEELTAIMSYSGENTLTIGEELNLKVVVDNKTNEPIVGLNGIVVYNKEDLELISMTGMEDPYTVSVNPKNAKFIGLSFELKGITKNATILNLKFKTLKTGTTTLDLKGVDLANRKAKDIPVTIISKEITINEPVITKEPEIVSEKTSEEIVEKEENFKENIDLKPTDTKVEEPKITENIKTEVKKEEPKTANKELIPEIKPDNTPEENNTPNISSKTPQVENKNSKINKTSTTSKSNSKNSKTKELKNSTRQEPIITKEVPNILNDIKALFIKKSFKETNTHLNLFSKLSELFLIVLK